MSIDTRPHQAEPTTRQLAAYALPALPIAALAFPFYVLVPEFYTREIGIPIAAVGLALLVVRIVDALTDPLAGALADWTRPAFGRRRAWVALSAPFVAISSWFVLNPPAGSGVGYLFGWALAMSLAWTAISVPYQAWGAELSRSYAGRTRVAAFREAMTVTGTLIALVLPVAVAGSAGASREGLLALALFVGVGAPLAALLAVAIAPEPVERVAAAPRLREGLKALAANAPFRRLLAAFFVNAFANGLPGALFLFFVTDRLGAREQAGPLLVLYFLAGVAGVPFWLWLARRLSKHRAWAIGMLAACVAFAAAPFLGPGQTLAFAAICLVTGFTLGADFVLPASVQADVIDVDVAATGQERAGLYLGLWAFASKLALAAAVGLAYPLLAMSGYDPAAGVRTEAGLAMLGVLYAGLPVLLKLAAVALVWRFPLGRDELAAIAARITAAREAGPPSVPSSRS